MQAVKDLPHLLAFGTAVSPTDELIYKLRGGPTGNTYTIVLEAASLRADQRALLSQFDLAAVQDDTLEEQSVQPDTAADMIAWLAAAFDSKEAAWRDGRVVGAYKDPAPGTSPIPLRLPPGGAELLSLTSDEAGIVRSHLLRSLYTSRAAMQRQLSECERARRAFSGADHHGECLRAEGRVEAIMATVRAMEGEGDGGEALPAAPASDSKRAAQPAAAASGPGAEGGKRPLPLPASVEGASGGGAAGATSQQDAKRSYQPKVVSTVRGRGRGRRGSGTKIVSRAAAAAPPAP